MENLALCERTKMEFDNEEYNADTIYGDIDSANFYYDMEGNKNFTIDDYPQLINDLLYHIDNIKSKDPSSSLIDIVMDFSFTKNIDIEAVSDAINSDDYLKSFIQKDCEFRGIVRNNSDW